MESSSKGFIQRRTENIQQKIERKGHQTGKGAKGGLKGKTRTLPKKAKLKSPSPSVQKNVKKCWNWA